jgi:sensor histidine kinase YesM
MPEFVVKSSYTVPRATVVGVACGLMIFLADTSGLERLPPCVVGGALISNAVWLCLRGIDRYFGPRVNVPSVKAFLVKYAAASFVISAGVTIIGLYFVGLAFHLRILSNPRTVLYLILMVTLTTAFVSTINFAQALYDQANALSSVRQLAAKAELKVLKAKINPHFLFNTLNTILQLVKTEPAKAEAMILNLSHTFRFALGSMDLETVSMEEELEFLNAYLDIERIRFEDALRVTIDVPETVLAFRVPPCVLQPLVENSIKHGIAPKLGGGEISVTARPEPGGVRVIVKDDGVGLSGDSPWDSGGIGIHNVQERLLAAFGPGSRLHIESRPEQGTSVSFLVPAQAGQRAPGTHGRLNHTEIVGSDC